MKYDRKMTRFCVIIFYSLYFLCLNLLPCVLSSDDDSDGSSEGMFLIFFSVCMILTIYSKIMCYRFDIFKLFIGKYA